MTFGSVFCMVFATSLTLVLDPREFTISRFYSVFNSGSLSLILLNLSGGYLVNGTDSSGFYPEPYDHSDFSFRISKIYTDQTLSEKHIFYFFQG